MLLYLQDTEGDENFHIYSVEVATKKVRDLTPFKGVRAQLLSLDWKYPEEILVGLNKRSRRVFDVHRINLKTGKSELDTKNPGNVLGWGADDKFRVRIAQTMTLAGGSEIKHRPDEKSPWKTILKWGQEDVDSGVLDFTKDGKGLILQTSEGRDTKALVEFDLATGKRKLIAADEGADVSFILYDGRAHKVQGVAFTRERPKWKILDQSIAKHMKFLQSKMKGDLRVVERTRDQSKWIVYDNSDVNPGNYYLYEAKQMKITHLFN